MIHRGYLAVVAVLALVGAAVWLRSAALRLRTARRSEAQSGDVSKLVTGFIAHDLHTAGLYAAVAVAVGLVAFTKRSDGWYFLGAVALPVAVSLWLARYARRDVRIADERLRIERRAQEVLEQNETAPARWAERLAPSDLPVVKGYEVGVLHEAMSGMMSGDLVDVFTLPSGRLCCVVGDVSGHDVEASITALQTKYLLRSYLRRFRDPGQALEELNHQVSDYERPEEFVSLIAMVFDEEAETVRYASAGHPAAWLSQHREPRPLRATGPLLMMDADSRYVSKELPFVKGDVVVAISDGIAEARSGTQQFGEERIAATVRKFEDTAPDDLCRELVTAAREFASAPLNDDVTVLAVRRTR